MEHFTLVYRSRPVFTGSIATYVAEVKAIIETARRKNAQNDVSGALLFNEDWFLQLLEGTEAAVRATFERVAIDPRHEEVEILFQRRTRERRLQQWSMAFVGQAPALRRHFNSSTLADPLNNLKEYEIVEFVVGLATSARGDQPVLVADPVPQAVHP